MRLTSNNIDEISNAGVFLAKHFGILFLKAKYKAERYDDPMTMLKMLGTIENDDRYLKSKGEKK